MKKNTSLIRAAAIIAQALPALGRLLVDPEPIASVREQLKLKQGLIDPELSIYFLEQIIPPINKIKQHIASRLEKR